MPKKLQKIEKEVMEKIKSGRVKLRSRYLFLAEKLGIESALALSFILAILFFSIVLYYMKESDWLAYLSFGRAGILAFLESFPYLPVVFFMIFLLVAGYLVNKNGLLYKQPFKYLAIGLTVAVLFIGGGLAYAGILERIEEQAFSSRIPGPIFRPFFEIGPDFRDRGIAGKISGINENYLTVKTPQGERKISVENLEFLPSEKFAVNQFIMAVGQREGDIFFAQGIKILEKEDMPMIRRGIRRRFGPDADNLRFAPPKLNFKNGSDLCPHGSSCEGLKIIRPSF